MLTTRRALLGGGVAATLWARGLGAAEAAFDLEAAALPGSSDALGYNGASPGPLLRVQAGATLKLRLANKLSSPTSLAFLGGRLANVSSGFAGLTGTTIPPGASHEFAAVPPDPGFNLYVAYPSPSIAGLFAGGLFGPLVVDEAVPPPVDLDAIVVHSRIGAEFRANTAPAPLKLSAPPGGRARVRLANATADLTMPVVVSGATAHVIAVDGQPSELFEPLGQRFPMAPSSRFELLFDLPDTAGGRVTFAVKGDAEWPMLQIETGGAPVAPKPAITALPENPRLPREIALERAQQVAVTLTGSLDKGFAVKGVSAKDWTAKPLFKAARGSPVSLTLVNKTEAPQTMRLEGHVARQLHALDDGWDPYWRDALPIAPGKTLHAAFVADNPGKWPLASASPEKRAAGMMGWFQVT